MYSMHFLCNPCVLCIPCIPCTLFRVASRCRIVQVDSQSYQGPCLFALKWKRLWADFPCRAALRLSLSFLAFAIARDIVPDIPLGTVPRNAYTIPAALCAR